MEVMVVLSVISTIVGSKYLNMLFKWPVLENFFIIFN
jgi:hypothetical protein